MRNEYEANLALARRATPSWQVPSKRRVFAYETRTPACRPGFIIALAMAVVFAAGVL